jgi:hypothetical protein
MGIRNLLTQVYTFFSSRIMSLNDIDRAVATHVGSHLFALTSEISKAMGSGPTHDETSIFA